MTADSWRRTPEGMFEDWNERIELLERRIASLPAIPAAPAPGDIKIVAVPTAAAGWALCDGASYTTAAQPELFAAIGYTFGGSGPDFNVPDLRGRVPVGLDAGQPEFDALGEGGGAKTHTLTTAEIPPHAHQEQFASNAIAAGGGATVGGLTSAGGSGLTAAEQSTADTGGGGAHNNLQPYRVVNFVIKL